MSKLALATAALAIFAPQSSEKHAPPPTELLSPDNPEDHRALLASSADPGRELDPLIAELTRNVAHCLLDRGAVMPMDATGKLVFARQIRFLDMGSPRIDGDEAVIEAAFGGSLERNGVRYLVMGETVGTADPDQREFWGSDDNFATVMDLGLDGNPNRGISKRPGFGSLLEFSDERPINPAYKIQGEENRDFFQWTGIDLMEKVSRYCQGRLDGAVPLE